MLRISKKADYAVYLLGAIARQGAYPGGSAAAAVVSAQEIAKQAGLNKSVVANLLKEFSKAGLLDSVRGLRGGYRLSRPPREVSLGEILRVVEGPFTLVDCIHHHDPQSADAPADGATTSTAPADSHECALISFCPTKNPMRYVHDRIANLFRQIRLDELCCLPTSHQPLLAGAPAPAPARTLG